MSDRAALKRQAAERAVGFVEDGMRLGLGTGSTARHVLEVIAERRGAGELRDIAGVPTSRATAEQARALGIPLTTLDETPHLQLTIDGCDEVDGSLDLIKGLGGALLWEKIVASASERVVIVADEGKRVERLGTKGPLPVEVVPFGWNTHVRFMQVLGAHPELRRGPDGKPFVTDGGHWILDCRFDGGIRDALAVESAFRARVGVVETGLFLGVASAVVLAGRDGVTVLKRGAS